jgi:ATP-dependent 26S proteasome regulatory subunit
MSKARENLLRVRDNINEVLIGNPDATTLVIISLITGGHVLLEDMPGTGKTTLARLLARLKLAFITDSGRSITEAFIGTIPMSFFCRSSYRFFHFSMNLSVL